MKYLYFFSIFLIGCGNDSVKENDKFILKFSKDSEVNFDFEQEMISSINLNCSEKPLSYSVQKINGLYTLKGTSDNLADLINSSNSIKFSKYDDNDSLIEEKTTQEPNGSSIEGIKTNLDLSVDDPGTNCLLDIMFALPLTDITIGESSQIPIVFPVSMERHNLDFVSSINVKYEKDTVINGKNMAILIGVIDKCKIDITKTSEISGDSYLKGNGKYIFDLEEHSFFMTESNFEVFVDLRLERDSKDDFCMFMNMESHIKLTRRN